VSDTDTVIVRASSFEIDSSKSSSKRLAPVCGHLGIDDDNERAFETLKHLCSIENVDKVIIVYRNYEFSLVGVSFAAANHETPIVQIDRLRKYKFQAQDVGLAGLYEL
jgi:hypothetical protein